jgi:hypothetical protein
MPAGPCDEIIASSRCRRCCCTLTAVLLYFFYAALLEFTSWSQPIAVFSIAFFGLAAAGFTISLLHCLYSACAKPSADGTAPTPFGPIPLTREQESCVGSARFALSWLCLAIAVVSRGLALAMGGLPRRPNEGLLFRFW